MILELHILHQGQNVISRKIYFMEGFLFHGLHFLAQTDQKGVRRGETKGKAVSNLSKWNSSVLQRKNL